eukprot:scaffold102863_cov67-Cyclotella_meneghiniana.AAC.1
MDRSREYILQVNVYFHHYHSDQFTIVRPSFHGGAKVVDLNDITADDYVTVVVVLVLGGAILVRHSMRTARHENRSLCEPINHRWGSDFKRFDHGPLESILSLASAGSSCY